MDDGNPFKSIFPAVYKVLNINCDNIDKRNYKGLLVEEFHKFINMAITIAAKCRGRNDIFVAPHAVDGCAWNFSPIDGTDKLRSVPTIGRERLFHLDIDFNVLSSLVSNNTIFLCLTSI